MPRLRMVRDLQAIRSGLKAQDGLRRLYSAKAGLRQARRLGSKMTLKMEMSTAKRGVSGY